MTIRINETPHDHIPETFTVESLRAGGMTEQEIQTMSEGDDPMVVLEDAAAADDAPATIPGVIGTVQPQAAQPAAPVQAAPVQVEEPKPSQLPDTSAAEAEIKRIQDAMDAAAEAYDDGALTRVEFLAQQKEMATKLAQAQLPLIQANQVQQEDQVKVAEHWQSRLAAYKDTAPDLWSDTHIKGWDAKLRAVTGDPGNGEMTRDQQIALAHRLYAAEYEARTGQALPVGAAPAAKKAETPKLEVRTDARPDPVSTLGGYTSDTSADVQDATFAAIDRIILKDPLQAEQMLAKLSVEDRERYLAEV